MQALVAVVLHVALCGVMLVVLGFYIAGTAVVARWMLEPINRAGGQLRASTRYLLTDFLGLMVLLQVALAISGVALEDGTRREVAAYWSLLGVFVLLVTILWAASVSVVSRAGIVRPLPRLTVIVLLIPGALAVVMSVPLLVILGLSGMFAGWLGLAGPWQAWSLPLAGLGLAALAAAGVVIRKLSFWALERSTATAAG